MPYLELYLNLHHWLHKNASLLSLWPTLTEIIALTVSGTQILVNNTAGGYGGCFELLLRWLLYQIVILLPTVAAEFEQNQSWTKCIMQVSKTDERGVIYLTIYE